MQQPLAGPILHPYLIDENYTTAPRFLASPTTTSLDYLTSTAYLLPFLPLPYLLP